MRQLSELWIKGLRCIHSAHLALAPHSNLIFGENGAGKTSILEAAYLLGRGRSFRTRSSERVISNQESVCRIRGTVFADGLDHSLGIEIERGAATRARIDQQTPPALAEMARIFPVEILDPELHRLIEEGPSVRRRWLDWLVFHVEPGFADTWSRYQRVLRQRNAALMTGVSDLGAWDSQLVSEGERLAGFRARAFERLAAGWESLCEALVGVPVALGLQGGWERGTPLAEALQRAETRDRERGSTTVGPHRADVTLRVGGKHAREVLSRGQQKLAGAGLVLLQLEYLKATQETVPTLLLDDPSAELDRGRLDVLITRVKALEAQMIITALTRDFALFGAPEAVFHVERGGVKKV